VDLSVDSRLLPGKSDHDHDPHRNATTIHGTAPTTQSLATHTVGRFSLEKWPNHFLTFLRLFPFLTKISFNQTNDTKPIAHIFTVTALLL